MTNTRIVIVGSGVVGSATGNGLITKGHDVTFVDIDQGVIKKFKSDGFNACLPDEICEVTADISMFCVSTPSMDNGNVELSYIKTAVANHGEWLRNMHEKDIWPLMVIRSTVPPGTVRKVLLPIFEECSGLKAGEAFGLCMQPEFLRAESRMDDFLNPWMTLIGEFDVRSGNILEDLYHDFGGKMLRVSLETAEFEKYVHNIFNATKISFANQIWMIAGSINEKLGIDIDANQVLAITAETAEGCWNPFYGMTGGQPYGGTCLPKDIKGLMGLLKEHELSASLIEAVDKVNSRMEQLAEEGAIPRAVGGGLNWKRSPMLD